MKITLIYVGGLKKSSVKDAIEDYVKRIGNYCSVSAVEVKEGPYSKKPSNDDAVKKEAERIRKAIKPGDVVVALDDKGSGYTSTEFSGFISGYMSGGTKNLCFVVGGPFGLHSSFKQGANATLSLSRMTMPHEMALLLLVEQIYRAFTIIKGEPYSH